MNRKYFLGIWLAIVTVGSGALIGQTEKAIPADTKKTVKQTIRAYIDQDKRLKGAFLIKDERAGILRELQFDYVHDGVHATDQDGYYACVDFRQDGKVLDLDFYVDQGQSGGWEVSEIVIHKIDGKEVGR